ncbi:hypothetical protein [Tenacibaculum caenipelagi]|uniref:Uncharacterized protein n=1 Tax=Tenacibaculum caenipelagi TaxID=1325435 RepID=A0A4R6TE71_9FLAO|nr:hypothetical protein [Tenacibaculum caenipelagi]TDQ22753.1 hypothetical protein DFQ07_2771 [Tenacibaculum caenipelagi]
MENPVRKIYHRTKVNPELLEHGKTGSNVDFASFSRGVITDVLPKGKLRGIYFLSFVKELDTWSAIDYQGQEPANDLPNEKFPLGKAFICSHTNIRIEDNRSYLITEPTDLKDYKKENNHEKGYKPVDFELKENEKIIISYELFGEDFPPCGEFIFVIDEEKTCQ